MDTQQLLPFVLTIVMVGLLLGIGIIITDSFADAVRESTVVVNESLTMPAANVSVALSNGNITTFTKLMNATGICSATGYDVFLVNGTLRNSGQPVGCTNGTTLYAYYTYDDYETDSGTTLRASRDALGDISSDWIEIIVIVGVCALILFLVVRAFAMRGR